MRLFNKLYGISLFTLLLSVASCTSETEEQRQTPAPDPSGSEARREVMLTLKNKLSVVKTKAGDAIATADENKISSLDIYVFGSTTENGTYTYQERFSYRESSGDFPTGLDVTPLELTAVGSDGKQTNALLSLKKGLFVKLYCIANQSKLIDPATNAAFNGFIPLVQSNPGQPGNTVTEGTPAESDFLLFKSIQLAPASATDILKTPLPMTGAYATPLDLTDFSVSARLQLGFRLTRSVARFDIVNDAAASKFTIQSVSMANGRKGVSFFPLKVTGTLPTAAAGDLITYPARPFNGEKANTGNCLGAFYTWPSPMGDGGYLVLSGTYATNQTENVPVTYKVPFKPEGDGNYIEVSQNHRYTVNITKADEYHLDFTINVEDWMDEGSIDDYEPGGNVDADGLVFTNTSAGDITYDADTRTVTMGITGTEQFTLTGASTSGYFVTMYYENGDQDNQWLEVTPAPDYVQTKADDNSKVEYTVKLVEHYVGKYPVATLRFTDKITAKETIVMVQPFAKPTVNVISQSAESSFDDETNVCVLAQTTSVTDPYVQFKVFASGGSKMKFEAGYDIPNWLEVTPSADQSDPISNYKLTVNTSAANFPYPFPDAGKTIEFVNKANADMNQSIIVKMQSYLSVTGTTSSGSNYTSSSNTITFTPTLATTTSPYITLNVQATRGSKLTSTDFSAGSQQWIVVDQGMEQNNYSSSYKITLNALANDFPTDDISDKTFEVENKLDGKTKIPVTIKLVTSAPEFKSATPTSASSGAFSFYNGSTRNIHLFDDGSSVKLTVFSLGGCSVANKPAWVEVTTPSKSNCMEFTFKITGTADENATGNIVFTNSAGSLSIPVYARKKDIRLSGFATNNSYTSTSNIAASRPSITYYPSQKNYFTFKVRSPFGISASDNTNWINYPDITETVTQSNGDKIQTIKVTQYNYISASTSNTRRKTGTITLTGTTTAIKKYIDLKTEHMTCNDIATTEPPKEVRTNYGRYWMTQSLDWAKAGQYESYRNRCPEGWKLLSAPEITYLFSGRSVSHPGHAEIYYYNNSTDKSYAASKVGYTIVSGGAGWFFVPNESSENAFTLGVASGNNGCDLRCWRAYNGSTDN